MIFVNKLQLVFLFLIIYSRLGYSQVNLDKQFEHAKTIFNQEKYFDAVTEFKRLLFFDKESKFRFTANWHIGFSYKYGGKFSDALKYLTLAEMSAETFEEIYDCRIEIIKINILRRTTDTALKQLDVLENDPEYESKKTEISYWKGWVYILYDDWENAAKIFGKLDENHELRIISEKTNNELYSVGLAKTLSYIIPGAGQIYTGEYLNGIISLGWNLLWGYLTIEAFIEDRIFDGIIVGSLLWMRFYQGGVENAEKFAIQKNLEITNETLRYLQSEYSGPKP